MSDTSSDKAYLTRKLVAQRYSVNDRTISRWLDDARLGFPRPMVINARKFFQLDELEAWEKSRAAPSMNRKAA